MARSAIHETLRLGQKCSAHRKHGKEPCKAWAILGARVCRMHGGGSPAVRKNAALRVKEAFADLIDPERILREIAALAYFDPRLLFADDGSIKPPSEWPDNVAAAMANWEVLKGNANKGDGQLDTVIRPKVWDKPKALEMLAKHRGLLIERIEVSGAVNLVSRITAGRERVANARRK